MRDICSVSKNRKSDGKMYNSYNSFHRLHMSHSLKKDIRDMRERQPYTRNVWKKL